MKNGGILVVDDERLFADPHFDGAIYAKNAVVGLGFLAKEWVMQGKNSDRYLSELWLDHDLGNTQVSGKIIADFLSDLCGSFGTITKLRIDTIYIHTMNSVGGDTMFSLLKTTGYNVKRVSLPECKGE